MAVVYLSCVSHIHIKWYATGLWWNGEENEWNFFTSSHKIASLHLNICHRDISFCIPRVFKIVNVYKSNNTYDICLDFVIRKMWRTKDEQIVAAWMQDFVRHR